MKSSNTDYLPLIYSYYPQNIHPLLEKEYRSSPEFIKRKGLCQNSELVFKKDTLIQKLNITFGESSIQDFTLLHYFDPNLHVRVSVLDVEYSINISLMINRYYIYISDSKNRKEIRLECKNKDEEEIKMTLESLIRQNIHESYVEITKVEANCIVPNIAIGNKDFGEVTVADCLFTTHVW